MIPAMDTDPTLELSDIFIYPVKSLRGVALSEAVIESGRFVGDRNWLLVDADGRFMHMRDYPQMARIAAEITPRGIRVTAAGMGELEIDRPDVSNASLASLVHVQLWRRRAPVVPVGRSADAWFTAALGEPCRLMAFVPDAPALDVPSYEVHSSLQDATPFHLTTVESLADLNARLSAPIPMQRFRPNLVVRGGPPYAEDEWKRLSIGKTTLRWIKPCTRCVATTTDHLTGERHGRDPLLTLARYRRLGPAVVFGHYLVADEWGERLRVGDRVTVLA
jgi:uncharacterized protein YcbX